ncbi:MAG TPA: hypothetical protein VMB21_02280 [Candidatus Limnocylindria bacterium]|nr:hypothetical protein [Candidatus Limnocylindria bacterium]
MKRTLLTSLAAALALSACLADAKEDVKAAAQKLAEAANYSWTATTEIEGGQFTPAPVMGKAEKGGYAIVSSERDGNTSTAVLKGDKGVLKTDDGWQTAEEIQAAAPGGGGGRFRGMLLRARVPAAEVGKLADKAKELKAADGVVSGELTDEGAKEMASFGRRPGGQFPEPKNAKASVKFWLKDGQLSKVQVRIFSTMNFNGEDRDFTRTTVYELKDVGTTKVEVPEEAKKKLGA